MMKQYDDELKKLLQKSDGTYQLYQTLKKMDIPIMSKLKCCFAHNKWTGDKRKEGLEMKEDIELFGLYVFPAGRTFLERFGGLKIIGGEHREWLPMKPRDFQYHIWSSYQLDIYTIGWWEALQQEKNELLVPIATERRYWDDLEIYWGESGKVYYMCGDYIGIRAQNLTSFFAQVFELEENLERSEWCEEIFAEYDWCDEIAEQVNQAKYVTYAQKRFAQNEGIPDPVMATDAFTQWLLSLE